jgi:hypothetical protein
MNEQNIKEAKRIAEVFVKQAKVVLADKSPYGEGIVSGTRHTGTLRRLSLDLTRALADMRRP